MITSMCHSVCSIIEILHAPTAVTITVFCFALIVFVSQVSELPVWGVYLPLEPIRPEPRLPPLVGADRHSPGQGTRVFLHTYNRIRIRYLKGVLKTKAHFFHVFWFRLCVILKK